VNQDDPFASFGDEDKTVIRPSPGGRRPASAPVGEPPPRSFPASEIETAGRVRSFGGDNPMIAASLSLMSLAARLRVLPSHTAIEELRQRLAASIREFENAILRQGANQEQMSMASYALCSFMDEAILNTPWGAQSGWGHQSLLVNFHKEAWGGEKFFQIVDHLARQPAQNLHLLELCYLFVSLGFQGKYRIAANGLNDLERYRIELYQLIQRLRGDFERELSPRWQGLKDIRNAVIRHVPLWVVGAGLAALLILAYLGFAFAIDSASDPSYYRFFALAKDDLKLASSAPAPVAATSAPSKTERFKSLQAQDKVEVVDDRTLRIRNSFASGSDQIKPEFIPILQKIAEAMASSGDYMVVTGHTDNIPSRSARFPSNYELSKARAKNVADMLTANGGLDGRVRHEGRADGEPLAPNDSPEHRALNRRVDILLR
jgi:type VI secretion system protein ImpK